MCMIEEFGKNLRSIKLTVNGFLLDFAENHLGDTERALYCIGNGCPKLKTLILEAEDESPPFSLSLPLLDEISDMCKELKELKFTNWALEDFFDDGKIKEIFPKCNVELKECYLNASCVQCEMYLEDCLCSGNFHFPYDPFNSDFDDQDSNYEKADDILDNFDGSEIELLFTQDYEGQD